MRGRRHVRRRRDGAQEGPCRAPDIRWRPIASNGRGAHVARTESRRSDTRDGRHRRLPAAPWTHTATYDISMALERSFVAGGGEMGARIREMDWSQTPLGPVGEWPQSLRSALSILLPSKAQIALCWGPQFITLYK